MTDFYRDRVRHGGIYSDKFIEFWQNNQVVPNQYGNPDKKGRRWAPGKFGPPVGPECREGTLTAEERAANRRDQSVDNPANRYLDTPYHASRVYKLSDIEVPVLSVANLGGILLHLRGNVIGYMEAGTRNKWLWFISGRHDLPFYLPHFVKLQKSFLDAWLKGEDDAGWKQGPNAKIPAVNLLVRKGNPGFNSTEAEATFAFRQEKEWPLARTRYEAFYLQPDLTMATQPAKESKTFDLQALGKSEPFNFTVKFDKETEIAGHPTANLIYSVPKRADGSAPRDIDVFVTLRHLDKEGKEIFYTGTAGDPVPLCKGERDAPVRCWISIDCRVAGWLRASVRAINDKSPRHHDWLPHREYKSTEVSYVELDQTYELLVEIWPTACVIDAGNSIVLEVNTADSQGCGIFEHCNVEDRNEKDFGGVNRLHVGGEYQSWLKLPVV